MIIDRVGDYDSKWTAIKAVSAPERCEAPKMQAPNEACGHLIAAGNLQCWRR
jgi:hypothetical protein